jgi:predicted RNA-binding protein YlqC (UPF0109 family)
MTREEIALELVKLIVNDKDKISLTNEEEIEAKAKNIAKAYKSILKDLKENQNANDNSDDIEEED